MYGTAGTSAILGSSPAHSWKNRGVLAHNVYPTASSSNPVCISTGAGSSSGTITTYRAERLSRTFC